jgi:hypothetical protein
MTVGICFHNYPEFSIADRLFQQLHVVGQSIKVDIGPCPAINRMVCVSVSTTQKFSQQQLCTYP